MSAPLVAAGRERELRAFAAALEPRQPVVVAITGPNGSGKSFVTARAVALARTNGWRVPPYRGGRGVRVGTGTSGEELLAEAAQALHRPVPDAGSGSAVRALAELLVAAAEEGPVGLVLDPYLPGPRLTVQIRRELLPAVRSSGRPIALVFVARRALTEELRPDLDLAITAPTTDGVERTLREAVAGLEPPVEGPELDAYVQAARQNPRLLASLEAVLPLGGYSGDGRSGPITPGSSVPVPFGYGD